MIVYLEEAHIGSGNDWWEQAIITTDVDKVMIDALLHW